MRFWRGIALALQVKERCKYDLFLFFGKQLQWHFGLVPSCSPSSHEEWHPYDQVYFILVSATMPGFRATALTYLALIAMESTQARHERGLAMPKQDEH
nr:hypothetical protein [uncultured Pedobacter sp.]